MRSNIFYEKFNDFSSHIEKNVCFFKFSHRFSSNYKFENANIFHFLSSMWSESGLQLFQANFKKVILEK